MSRVGQAGVAGAVRCRGAWPDEVTYVRTCDCFHKNDRLPLQRRHSPTTSSTRFHKHSHTQPRPRPPTSTSTSTSTPTPNTDPEPRPRPPTPDPRTPTPDPLTDPGPCTDDQGFVYIVHVVWSPIAALVVHQTSAGDRPHTYLESASRSWVRFRLVTLFCDFLLFCDMVLNERRVFHRLRFHRQGFRCQAILW